MNAFLKRLSFLHFLFLKADESTFFLLVHQLYHFLVMQSYILQILAETGTLPERYRPHKLSGRYSGYWECHIIRETSKQDCPF